AGLPLVLVDSQALPEHGSVEVDDVGGAREAAAYLAQLGHREVLVLGVEPPSPGGAHPEGVTARRLRGYREGFRGVGVRLAAGSVISGPATIDGGAAAIREAWERGRRPT